MLETFLLNMCNIVHICLIYNIRFTLQLQRKLRIFKLMDVWTEFVKQGLRV